MKQHHNMGLIKKFSEIKLTDLKQVGGKNASLGEMFNALSSAGIKIPDGFSTTASAYWHFLDHNGLRPKLNSIIQKLETNSFSNLSAVGVAARNLILGATFPVEIKISIQEGVKYLVDKYGTQVSFAVRSSATAEDLPEASFAGQQETFLNISGFENVLNACHRCYASLYTDRAIKYRIDNGFDHNKVALSVGVQLMVRSDKASAGVMFTLDPDSGFENVVVISGAWGLGENVVQGHVNTDEFTVFKTTLGKFKQPIISRKLGSKAKVMKYVEPALENFHHAKATVVNLDTPLSMQQKFVLSDFEIIQLAKWGCEIEKYYGHPMDIEWAKDGVLNKLFIVQARPETVQSRKHNNATFTQYKIKDKGEKICSGIGLGNRIASGIARILNSPLEINKLSKGEVLVTKKTDPDWDPILKKAAAIVTDQGGRTSHAAIVAREVGAVAVVGTGKGTQSIRDGQLITVSSAEGEAGFVYDGKLKWSETTIDLGIIHKPKTNVMLILGDPEQAFKYSFLPSDGIGLMRMEFIINNAIQIHPMALKHFNSLKDTQVKSKIDRLTHHYPTKEDYFIHKLAEATSTIAAAFYPREVIVRMSDFKSNEYANLIGGNEFEPEESNPMIGFRGASRYYHPLYREAFEMECKAMKYAREEMGFANIKLMIPFCRTLHEAQKIIDLMAELGLKRGDNGLELYMMAEIPSNALLADKFAEFFDGFSIGSNDLTQLTLGADRDSGLLSEIFSPYDEAVEQLIAMTIEKSRYAGVKIGFCGQAPSDYPEFASFLVDKNIGSISFTPDALFAGIENINRAEEKFTHTRAYY